MIPGIPGKNRLGDILDFELVRTSEPMSERPNVDLGLAKCMLAVGHMREGMPLGGSLRESALCFGAGECPSGGLPCLWHPIWGEKGR